MTSDTITSKEQGHFSSLLSDLKSKFIEVLPRSRDFIVHAIAQVRIYNKVYPGVMHALIFWGVTIQLVGTAINLMQMALFIPLVELPFPRGNVYLAYELIMDLAGVAILIGVTMAALRRLVFRPKYLETRWDDYYALIILTLVPLVGFTVEGTRILISNPTWAVWSPVGNLVANIMRSLGMTTETAMNLHSYLFWIHAALGLIFIASIPFTKLRHLVTTPLNVILHPRRKTGELEKIEDIEETEILGVGNIQEFTSTQLLSFDACLRCGRCEDACPATYSGMPYSPRVLIQDLRTAMQNTLISTNGKGKEELIGDTISEDTPWYCTTCGACLNLCPAFVNPIDEVVDLRRYQTLTTGQVPKSVGDTLRNIERQGNPWGMPPEDRMAWAEDLEIREIAPGDETDVLLFLGCAFAFDDRNKKVSQSFVNLLQRANVDFATLGLDETCCGETARRLGHEYLFQVFAEQNIELLNQVKFNRIVTQCPHCFNTLKNEYPQFGGNFAVQHYTEFLANLDLQPALDSPNGSGIKGTVTYHDSCYLGRYNQIYKQPRSLLNDAHVSTVEMRRKEEDSFCCGGGGGQMWMETDTNTRINHRRLEDALEINADIIATACPYCMLMFDDAISSKGIGEQVEVLDIAEVLDKQTQ
jgi:Fe-S oxidoreductase/nitrate reductase gamma subunit